MPTDKRQRQKEGQRARRAAAMAAARRRQRRTRMIIAVVVAVAIVVPLLLVAGTGGGGSSKKTLSLAVGGGKTVSIKVDKTAPKKLVINDLKTGTGKTVKLNQNIEVNYVGVTYSDGKVFDSSFTRGQPATFPLKEGGLIEGWVKGIPGMKVGGRRELIIPASMAYGDNPSGGQPAGTLVFVVDLVAIK